MAHVPLAAISFFLEGAGDGVTNMARDAELLKCAEEGRAVCRVYNWAEVWITLGRFQSPERDLYPEAGIPWVMRPTGGKAVLHGHDVTVGLAVPLSLLQTSEWPAERLARSITTVYRTVISPLVEALRACGLPAALAEQTRSVGRGPKTADCFTHISPNDVVDERTGQKVCGCALRLTQSAVLVQASIPVGQPLVDPASLIRGGQALVAPPWQTTRFSDELSTALSKAFQR